MENQPRYFWLKFLTILGPTAFVAVGEWMRETYLRFHYSHLVVSFIAIATTMVAAVIFSWFMFRTLNGIEEEQRSFKEAISSLKERERISREMHDGIAQNLAVLKLEAYKLRELVEHDSAVSAEMETLDKLINQTYLEVRQSLYDLRASQRLEDGFWSTIDKQTAEFQRQTGIDVTLRPPTPLEEPWNQLASVQILRIIQEALSNVRRHSRAHRVNLVCQRQGRMMRFTIEDDGWGFETQPVGSEANHYGLSVMRERAESIGGGLAVESRPGAGTTVTLTVPAEGRSG